MRSDFMLAINQLCAERKLSPEVVLEAVEASLISAYKRNFGAAANIEVHIEPDSGDVRVFAVKEVVDDVADRKTQILLSEAAELEPGIELGQTVLIESTPRDFGRIAAQTAKQVILQRIREAERDALYSSFADSAGEIAHGTVQSHDLHSGDVVINIEGAEALLPSREQVPGERYRRGTRWRAYVLDVRRGNRGPQITLSRRSPALLRRLLELEVPEIFNGSVEIKAIAREAGSRSKVAVHATQEGVDPVGSCVGVRGGRIQNVVNELGGEKIDVVQWASDIASFIANSLSPAKVMNVLLDDNPDAGKTATVIVPDRQLSLAIGKEGQNARLAAKLTGWRIDIKSASEAAEETLGRLEDIQIAPEDMDLLTLAEVLLRKQEAGAFDPEQRSMIEAAVGEPPVDWPEEEPALEEESLVAREPVEELEAAAGPAGEEVEEPLLEADLDALAAAGPEGPTGEVQLPAPDEEEQVPPFEGGFIEESSGWAFTPPEEESYPSWATEDALELPEFEWVRDDEEEEEEEDFRRESKKKKGKKRRPRPLEFQEDLGESARPKRGQSRPSGR